MSNNSPVIAYEVNSAVREELGEGFKMSEFITDKKIESCSVLLKQAADSFFEDAAADLEQLEDLVKQSWSPINIQLLQTSIHNIKNLAKVLGFTLITEICIHSLIMIDSDLPEEKKEALLKKLVETLRLSFNQRIRDEGGDIGKTILAKLRDM